MQEAKLSFGFVINEQQSTTSNALHVVIDGVADVIVGSATAGIQ